MKRQGNHNSNPPPLKNEKTKSFFSSGGLFIREKLMKPEPQIYEWTEVRARTSGNDQLLEKTHNYH